MTLLVLATINLLIAPKLKLILHLLAETISLTTEKVQIAHLISLIDRLSEIPIQAIIDSKLNKLGFGIEGYFIRKYNPFLDKPKVNKIVNTKKSCFLDEYVKVKSLIKVANMDMSLDLLDKKKKSSLSRSPRVTMPQEIEKREKKFTKPGPGAYTVKENSES